MGCSSPADLPTGLFGTDRHTERNSGRLPWHVVQAHGKVTWASSLTPPE